MYHGKLSGNRKQSPACIKYYTILHLSRIRRQGIENMILVENIQVLKVIGRSFKGFHPAIMNLMEEKEKMIISKEEMQLDYGLTPTNETEKKMKFFKNLPIIWKQCKTWLRLLKRCHSRQNWLNMRWHLFKLSKPFEFRQQARRKLIYDLSDVNVGGIGVKIMGKLDSKPFYTAAEQG